MRWKLFCFDVQNNFWHKTGKFRWEWGKNTKVNKQLLAMCWPDLRRYGAVSYSFSCKESWIKLKVFFSNFECPCWNFSTWLTNMFQLNLRNQVLSAFVTKDRSLPRLKYAIKTIVELRLRYVCIFISHYILTNEEIEKDK